MGYKPSAQQNAQLDEEDDELSPEQRPSRRRVRKAWRSIGRSSPRLKLPGRFEQLILGLIVGALLGFAAGWIARPPSTVVLPAADGDAVAARANNQSLREREALESIRAMNAETIRRNPGSDLNEAGHKALYPEAPPSDPAPSPRDFPGALDRPLIPSKP